jgi:hypothetical protein
VLKKPIKGWPVPLKENAVNPANVASPAKKDSTKKKRKSSARKSSVQGKGVSYLHEASIGKEGANGECEISVLLMFCCSRFRLNMLKHLRYYCDITDC